MSKIDPFFITKLKRTELIESSKYFSSFFCEFLTLSTKISVSLAKLSFYKLHFIRDVSWLFLYQGYTNAQYSNKYNVIRKLTKFVSLEYLKLLI